MAGLVVVAAILGIAGGFALGSMTIYTYDISPDRLRARLQAQRRTLGEAGGFSGPAIAGGIATVYGAGPAFLFLAPLHVISTVLLILFARESLGRKAKQLE